MFKLIDPGKPQISELFCDGCKKLIVVEGREQELKHELSLYISGQFGFFSSLQGTVINVVLCEECGLKSVIAVETILGIKILPTKESI